MRCSLVHFVLIATIVEGLCCGSISTLIAQQDSTLLPLKSLAVGNRWVYNAYYEQTYYSYTTPYRFYESVIADTIVQGKRFAKVYNSYTRSYQFERSDATKIYIWDSEKGEQVYQEWNRDSTVFQNRLPWTIFSARTFRGSPAISTSNSVTEVTQRGLDEDSTPYAEE